MEMDAFASVAAHAPVDDFEAAVKLIEKTSAGFTRHAESSRHVTDDLIDAQPALVGRFYTHLMQNTSPQGFYGTFEVRPKVERLLRKPGDWSALRAAAFNLGMDFG